MVSGGERCFRVMGRALEGSCEGRQGEEMKPCDVCKSHFWSEGRSCKELSVGFESDLKQVLLFFGVMKRFGAEFTQLVWL